MSFTKMAAIQEARVFKLWQKEQLLDEPILMLNRLI
jgi:hypothetical protein